MTTFAGIHVAAYISRGRVFPVSGNMENEIFPLKFKVKMTDTRVEVFSVRES